MNGAGAQVCHVVSETEHPSEGERDLLLRARIGDRSALERLLACHERPLYNLCLRILCHSEDAEDAVQDTYLRAISAIGRFRGDASICTWLTRIAVRVCLDRTRRRRDATPLDEAPPRALKLPSAESAVIGRILLDQALRALPIRQRTVLLLKEWRGWSVPEIAEALGCKPRRVNTELASARHALSEWLLSCEK